jgi:hypothetical protein
VQRLVTETRNSQTARGTPPSASTLRHVYKLVRNGLGDAYRMELVTRNVATQVKAPPLSSQRRLGLDLAEAKRLLKVIDGERLEALYVLALTTGLRRGELLALRWVTSISDLGNFMFAGRCNVSMASSRSPSRRRAVPGGPSCCPGSRCAISKSTRSARMLSAWRWAMLGVSTGWCSRRLSGRRSSRATSTGAGRAAAEGGPGRAPAP